MSTYRERREARADRLREWADKRESKAEAIHTANEAYRGDHAFNTQPGHIPERARVIARTERAFEHSAKATEMRRKAENIEAAADRAIYSDDPDAVERLTEKLADLEAQRDRIKRYNASCRKGARDISILDDAQREKLLSIAKVASFQLGPNGEYPRYGLSNLSGVIKTARDRLAKLSAS